MTKYREYQQLLGDELFIGATTETGERQVIECFGADEDGYPVYQVSTFQSNGWTRINWYYRDGTVEETFER